MPYFLAEDPTMPADRARDLLHAWREEKPWQHYPDSRQSQAVQLLATRGHELSQTKLEEAVATLRATE